jgi:hypothetical protein
MEDPLNDKVDLLHKLLLSNKPEATIPCASSSSANSNAIAYDHDQASAKLLRGERHSKKNKAEFWCLLSLLVLCLLLPLIVVAVLRTIDPRTYRLTINIAMVTSALFWALAIRELWTLYKLSSANQSAPNQPSPPRRSLPHRLNRHFHFMFLLLCLISLLFTCILAADSRNTGNSFLSPFARESETDLGAGIDLDPPCNDG